MAFNDNRGGSYHNGGGGNQRQEIVFPNPVKVKAFYENGNIIPTLFSEFADEVAHSLGNSKNGVSSTQLRKFFDEVKRYDSLLGMPGQSWKKQEAYIRMLKSKVNYAVARKSKETKNYGFYKNLSAFIDSGINLVDSPESYHVFTSLFEAVYGFYYELAPDRK